LEEGERGEWNMAGRLLTGEGFSGEIGFTNSTPHRETVGKFFRQPIRALAGGRGKTEGGRKKSEGGKRGEEDPE